MITFTISSDTWNLIPVARDGEPLSRTKQGYVEARCSVVPWFFCVVRKLGRFCSYGFYYATINRHSIQRQRDNYLFTGTGRLEQRKTSLPYISIKNNNNKFESNINLVRGAGWPMRGHIKFVSLPIIASTNSTFRLVANLGLVFDDGSMETSEKNTNYIFLERTVWLGQVIPAPDISTTPRWCWASALWPWYRYSIISVWH